MADKDQYVCPASVPPSGMVNPGARFSEGASVQGRREWPLWAVMLVRWPLMGPLAAAMFAGQLADFAFDWLDRHLPGAAPYRPRRVPYV